jgi:hypothetical protein
MDATAGILAQPENTTAVTASTPPRRPPKESQTLLNFSRTNPPRLLPPLSMPPEKTTAALTHALLNPVPATPFASIGDAQQQALTKLADIFNSTFQTPLASPRVPATQATTPAKSPREPAPKTPSPILPNTTDHTCHRYPLRSQRHPNGTAYNVTSTKTGHFEPVHLANTVTNPITGKVQEYQHLVKGLQKDIWTRGFANELGRLAQGVGDRMKKGTETKKFHPKT